MAYLDRERKAGGIELQWSARRRCIVSNLSDTKYTFSSENGGAQMTT